MREEKIVWIPINEIKPDPEQPRKSFDEEKLRDSAESYKAHGTIVPIEIDEHNKIIVGELRWRASKMAGLKEIPCTIKKGLKPTERLERQLVENLNRQNIPVTEVIPEIKRCLASLTPSKFAREDQQTALGELSKRLGVSKSWLSGLLKLDNLPKEVKNALKKEEISVKHATMMLGLPTDKEKVNFLASAKIENVVEFGKEISDYIAPRKEIKEKIKKPEVQKRAIEELEKVEKRVKRIEEDIKKEKKEAVKDIVDTGRRIEKKERIPETIFRTAHTTFLTDFQKTYNAFCGAPTTKWVTAVKINQLNIEDRKTVMGLLNNLYITIGKILKEVKT